MRRIGTAVVISALAVLATGCGGVGDPPFDSKEDAVKAFGEAVSDGDVEAICAMKVDNDSGKHTRADEQECRNGLSEMPEGLDASGDYKVVEEGKTWFQAAWGDTRVTVVPFDGGWMVEEYDFD